MEIENKKYQKIEPKPKPKAEVSSYWTKKRVQQDHSFIIPKKENKIVELIQSILKIMNFLILSMKNIKI